jgi:hypothetical protein
MVAIVRAAKPLAGDDRGQRNLLGVMGAEAAAEGEEAKAQQEDQSTREGSASHGGIV